MYPKNANKGIFTSKVQTAKTGAFSPQVWCIIVLV